MLFFFFRNFELLIFALCFILPAAQSLKKVRLGARNLVFRDPVANFEVEGTEIFGTKTCDRTGGFYHVLSVFVVLSVSVKSAMECQMTCLMKCFLRCVSERYDVKSRRSPFKKKNNRLRRQRKPLACAPSIADFLEHLTAACPCDTRGSKVPAILRDWQEQDTERAVL